VVRCGRMFATGTGRHSRAAGRSGEIRGRRTNRQAAVGRKAGAAAVRGRCGRSRDGGAVVYGGKREAARKRW